MSGMNSNFSLKTRGCTTDVYTTRGMEMAVYRKEKRSKRKTLGLVELSSSVYVHDKALDLHWSDLIKAHQYCDEPEEGIKRLYQEFLWGEE
jgi:hypothetical protein